MYSLKLDKEIPSSWDFSLSVTLFCLIHDFASAILSEGIPNFLYLSKLDEEIPRIVHFSLIVKVA